MERFAANGMLLESVDLNLIKLFFRYANFVPHRYKSCKCFKGFQVFLFDFYLCGLIFSNWDQYMLSLYIKKKVKQTI